MQKILCIGEALIDMICTDKGQPLSVGENFLKKAGGAPANVAAAIAALGGQVEMSAKVGVDPFGQHIADLLNQMGVGTTNLIRDPHHFTTFAFVSLMQNGERDFYFNRGADGHLSVHDIANLDLKAYGLIHFGSATAFLGGPLQEAYAYLLKAAHEYGILVSFDPNYRELLFGKIQGQFTQQAWEYLKTCHFFKVSDEEAFLLTGEKDMEACASIFIKETQAAFAITLGAAGTLFGVNGTTKVVESIPVNPVDTTGAGDAFVGAVLFQLQEMNASPGNLPDTPTWHNMVQNANKAGARTCMYMGAMEAFKHLNRKIFE